MENKTISRNKPVYLTDDQAQELEANLKTFLDGYLSAIRQTLENQLSETLTLWRCQNNKEDYES